MFIKCKSYTHEDFLLANDAQHHCKKMIFIFFRNIFSHAATTATICKLTRTFDGFLCKTLPPFTCIHIHYGTWESDCLRDNLHIIYLI